MRFAYAVSVVADGDGFTASFPDVPEALGAGDSRAEALATAAEALGDALLTYVELGRAIPEPRTYRGGRVVAVPAAIAAKLAVYETWRRSGLTKAAFGAQIGATPTEVQRILDPDHATRLDTLARALAGLGKHLVIAIEDDAAA